MRIEHIHEACNAILPVSVVATLRYFLNALISGSLPCETSPYLAGASLVALQKTDDNEPLDIRPIAVGEIYRRLAGKCLCHAVSDKARAFLQPFQLGVASPLGTERIVHHMRSLTERHWQDDDFVILKVDMRNAFNSVSRQLVMDQCSEHFPELFPWVKFCYERHPHLWHTLGRFASACGVQQGDPLGPLLFAIAIHPLVTRIGNTMGIVSNKWYLDDGIICGTRTAVLHCLQLIEAATLESGLELNLKKCEVYSRGDLGMFPSDCKKSHSSNFEILGAPIGDDDYCEAVVDRKSARASGLLVKLRSLDDPQVALTLLRNCAGFGRLVHIARCCPAQQTTGAFQKFDNAILQCFEDVTGISLSDTARLQSQISISRGGIGLRSLSRHCSAAYISSAVSCETERDLSDQFQQYNIHVSENHFVTSDSPHISSQSWLSNKIDDKEHTDLQRCSNAAEASVLEAVSAKHASDWLLVVPSPGLGFRYSPDEYQCLLQSRLRLDLPSSGSVCPVCECTIMDSMGHHALTCKKGPDVTSRHNHLRNAVHSFCRQGQLRPLLEQGANRDAAGTMTRPADVLIPTWSLGKAGAIDVTVVNPLNHNNLIGANTTVEDTLDQAEMTKHAHNDTKCRELGWVCLPLATTPYGGWGRESITILKTIAGRVGIATGEAKSAVCVRLFRALSVVLARSMARAILARTPVVEQTPPDGLHNS